MTVKSRIVLSYPSFGYSIVYVRPIYEVLCYKILICLFLYVICITNNGLSVFVDEGWK
uniref:Uncharacterized protein n=1 Tax=Rhizophora mucronata TaxID=61149 RepID=A0A2P2N3T4_RHIMU